MRTFTCIKSSQLNPCPPLQIDIWIGEGEWVHLARPTCAMLLGVSFYNKHHILLMTYTHPLYCSYRIRLNVNEKGIYENLALLVRWVDFESRTEKEKKGEEEKEKSRVIEGIKRFQQALEEVVRLVYEVHVLPEGGSSARTLPMNLQRR